MAAFRSHLLIYSLLAAFFLSLVTDWYAELIVFLVVVTTIVILDKLGKGLVLRELIVFYTIFICLLMPELGYGVYNYNNYLSRAFVRYMQVPEDVYFGYALPAVSAFSAAMCMPIRRKGVVEDEGGYLKVLLSTVKGQLATFGKKGILIVLVGAFFLVASEYLPSSLNFVAILFFFSCFAGVLYVYYAPYFRYKKILLLVFGVFILYGTIQSGVFTLIVYMGITIFSFLFLGRKIAFWKKLLAFVAGLFILFVIQSVKGAYRHETWKDEDYAGNKFELFSNITLDQLQNYDQMFDEKGFFPIYMRANQGFNVSNVMKRIPAVQDFDHGSRLLYVASSSLVPRFLWPDKPEAGGRESMKYFAGIDIYGWSTNVSPLGEAYGSFGTWGGVVYMALLGLFIRWAYRMVFVVARKLPLIVLWIPVLFYQVTSSMETDTLQILNSLIKGAFFLWLLYKIVPGWFGRARKVKVYRRRPMARPEVAV